MTKKNLREFGWNMIIDTDVISSVGGVWYDSDDGYHRFKATIGGADQTFKAKAKGLIFKSVDPDLEKLQDFLISSMK